MKYELAKKLKDAGFPMEMTDHELCIYQQCEIFPPSSVCYHIPSLSELIEACGFTIETKDSTDKDFIIWFYDKNWFAGYYKYGSDIYVDDYPSPSEKGNSPEEAVANLWLELNKKNI